jgi:hypothetical protein
VGLRGRICKFFFCAVLAFASLGGAPMRPEEVEELMHTMNQPKIAQELPDDTENEDDVIKRPIGTGAGPTP